MQLGRLMSGLGALALAFGLSAGPAAAHPHAFIENRTDVVFNDDGKIIALNIAWVFDKDYTAMAIDGLDANGDGYYAPGELAELTKANIDSLKEYNYFVYAYADGKRVGYGDVTEYGQFHANNVLKMHFTIPLKQPLDPKAVQFMYKVYDPSFYIAIEYARKDPIAAIGKKPKGCSLDLGKVQSDEKTEATRKELATKDKDWQPSETEEFGALFAQPVKVICKPKTAAR